MDFVTLSNFRTIKQKYGLSFLSKFIFANSTKMFWLLLKEAWCFISCFCPWSLLHIVSAFNAWPFSSSFYILTLLSHSKSLIDFLLIFKLFSSIANVFIRMKISFPKQNEYLSLQYLRFPTLKSFKISSFFLKYFVFPLWDLTISIPYFF